MTSRLGLKRVLFICTGNFYRSRYAEAYFNYLVSKRGVKEWEAFSRGLATELAQGLISTHTVVRLEKNKIPLVHCSEKPVQLAEEDLHSAQEIIALKREEHLPMMQNLFSDWALRINYWDVHDLDYAPPEVALPQIEVLVTSLLDKLTKRS